jgi:hypothetical protein
MVVAPDDFTNEATATGNDPNGDPVDDSDTAVVDVIHPCIDIEKDPDEQPVQIDHIATFTITVTNCGDVALDDVTVSDPNAPDCDRSFGTMAPGQVESYACTVVATGDWTLNTATATGTAPIGPPLVDSDDALLIFVEEVCQAPVNKKGKKKGGKGGGKATPPTSLLLQYDGTDEEVYIIVEHQKDGVIYEDFVADGGLFQFARRNRRLNPNIYVTIYSDYPDGVVIDYIQIHTSCSQPLYIGQTFGTDQSVAKLTVQGEPL